MRRESPMTLNQVITEQCMEDMWHVYEHVYYVETCSNGFQKFYATK